MNCANHPDIAAAAYCRTCGKPLCSNCTRDVRGVIYCENCLADRLQGVQPAAVVPPAPGYPASTPAPVVPSSGPNPALAGILAGFFPFGVGAVYTGQYAKGLAHLLIFFGLIFGADHGGSLDWLFGLGIAFFYVYQIIDSVRTAHAVQAGQPAPDPLGLGQAFGAGEKVDTSKVPTAAIFLIGIGALFLLQTMGVFEFSADRLWPVFLIALGGWLFLRRWGLLGTQSTARRYDRNHRMRGLMGPVVLVTVGVLSLSESLGGPNWGRTWPVLLLAIGLTQLLSRNAAQTLPPGPAGGPMPPAAGEVQPQPPSEVNRG
jgi:hypothetical protein